MKDIQTIIKALRCSNDPKAQCDHSCVYYGAMATEEEINCFLREHGHKREDFHDDFFTGCHCDDIVADAADALEELIK